MNIDLLINDRQDIGLVATGKFDSPVTAALFDHATYTLSLEFGETMDAMELNVPVAVELAPYLGQRNRLFMIGTDKTYIHEAYSIPLMHLNNPAMASVGEW